MRTFAAPVRIINMRSVILFAAAVLCSSAAMAQSGRTANDQSRTQPAKPVPIPLQLDMRVPFEPTAFPSDSRTHLLYELHLTNFTASPSYVSRIEVIDPDAVAQPIAAFPADQLGSMSQPVGGKTTAGPEGSLSIPGGRTLVVFMSIAFDNNSHVPARLIHRVITAESSAEGAVIATHHTSLHLLGPPLEGPNWLAADGPGNDPDNHHRRGIFVIDGRAVISRRYAIDWKQVEHGTSFSGDPRDTRSYYSYGKPVLAVADGLVVTARDGLPDNIPGHNEAFHPAVPITFDTIAGNTVTIDLGGGQFAYYLHMQPGSVRVKAGERVRRGQLMGRVGCSGDAREPHLHFEVTDSSKLGAGEGLPYLIDKYSIMTENGGAEGLHTRELPLNNSLVDFGGSKEFKALNNQFALPFASLCAFVSS